MKLIEILDNLLFDLEKNQKKIDLSKLELSFIGIGLGGYII